MSPPILNGRAPNPPASPRRRAATSVTLVACATPLVRCRRGQGLEFAKPQRLLGVRECNAVPVGDDTLIVWRLPGWAAT